MFDHLHIYDPAERRLVGAADAGLAVIERVARLAARGGRPRTGEPPRRILLLRLERIGDLVMALPAIDAVRALAPAARIDLAVGSWNGSLARAIGGVEVEIVDAPWLARDGSATRGALLQHARGWRARDYDLAINFEGDIRSHVLMRMSGATRRVGFDMAGGGPVLTDRVAFDPTRHTASNALRLVAHAFGVDPGSLEAEWLDRGRTRLTLPSDARDRAAAALANLPRPLIGIQPGGGRAIKQWPPDRFGAVAAALAERHAATIVFTGSAGDRRFVDDARRMVPSSARVLDVSNTRDLLDLAAILRELDLFITGDTGPMHLADAVGTPLVAIFGLTTPARWGPLSRRSRVVRIDLSCSPCNRVRRPPERCVGIVPDCLSGISADDVVAAASSALGGAIPLTRL